MSLGNSYDAIVIGSGPNGLAAGITLAKSGLSVALLEGKSTVGGGMRSAELTLPGFIHDICSAVHPLGIGSPFFKTLPLEEHGLQWIQPTYPLAHPFDHADAAILDRSIEATCQNLQQDAANYKKLLEPLVINWHLLVNDILAPLHMPQHPLIMAEFGLLGIQSAVGLTRRKFKDDRTRSFFDGIAAHSNVPLDRLLTASFGLVLGVLGHVNGWPIPRGGSQKIAGALASVFSSFGGKIFTDFRVDNIDDLPKSKAVLCDVSPKELLRIAGHKLSSFYTKQLEAYRYGPGVFKMDWALSSPIPWKDPKCRMAGTVHLGASSYEIARSEREVFYGSHPDTPFVILAQPSLFDDTRAPNGQHTAWGYCHVPNRSNKDMSEQIEGQIERFAPGFKDCILAKSVKSAVELEKYNSNYVGGDINVGIQDIFQHYFRPALRLDPYATSLKNLYICSSATPPGGAVHGMCGYHAALAALKTSFKN